MLNSGNHLAIVLLLRIVMVAAHMLSLTLLLVEVYGLHFRIPVEGLIRFVLIFALHHVLSHL